MSAAVATAVTTTLPSNSGAHTTMDAKRASLKVDNEPSSDTKEQKPDGESNNSLAPPPRPNPTGATDTPDYFNSVHNPFALEPNPFEQSFGGSGETPGKSILPPVASITSPAIPGATSAGGAYNWSNSLRSGPLSPAMLAGPAGGNDYFDSIGRGFPTPNESSLRTGLTPGGGGSMFPAPSPNSQALINQLQNGGATPSTIDFHRTAFNVAAKKNGNAPTSNPTTEPEVPQITTTMDIKTTQPAAVDPFGHHDAASDAANGLFMLAKGGQQNANQFAAVPNQTSIPPQTIQASEITARRQSINPNGVSNITREPSGDGSDPQSESKPAVKGRGKRNASVKASGAAAKGRKTEDAIQVSNKKTKLNNGSASTESPSEGESDDEDQPSQKKKAGDGKKMTDEEKRKNFLERNRVAALKCRQRKKQWLANLQAKVELFTSENDALTTTVTQLREEIVNLKTLLLAHKDCPVSQAQGLIWNPNPPYT